LQLKLESALDLDRLDIEVPSDLVLQVTGAEPLEDDFRSNA
jgi:hypothetical protein